MATPLTHKTNTPECQVVVFKWKNEKGWPVEYVSPNVVGFFGHSAEDFMTGRVPYIDVVHPDELTIASVPARLAAAGDPWAEMNARPQSLEPMLELHERDRAAGLMDAPWPPVYPKQPDEPPRVAPSRARKAAD